MASRGGAIRIEAMALELDQATVERLVAAAQQVADHAYVPASGFHVHGELGALDYEFWEPPNRGWRRSVGGRWATRT